MSERPPEPAMAIDPARGLRQAGGGSVTDRVRREALLRVLRRLRRGTLDLTLPDGGGETIRGPAPGPRAALSISSLPVLDRYLWHGSVGFAESYMAGEWDTPHLAELLELLDRNGDAWGRGYFGPALTRFMARTRHRLRRNSRAGSRRNIQAHYDLGNDFFAAWLDPSMTYSAALFEAEEERSGQVGLEAAQAAKYRHLCRMIDLRPGQRLLEIGSGWGGFARIAATEFGARVMSITISPAQHALASARIATAGLNDRVEIRLQDYRDVEGRFDRIASIEMLEAVGEAYWPVFFEKLRSALVPGGRAGLQVITIADRHFESYRRGSDFIQQYVLPGGMLPSTAALAEETQKAGFEITEKLAFGGDYARTLALWAERFEAAWDDIREQGFDERFRRLWRYYLAYCEAGFRSGSTDVVQLGLRRD